MSRAPVRDAFRALELDGLVVSLGRRGKVVPVPSASDAWEVYSLRATLEAIGIRLAIDRGGDPLLAELEELVEDMRHAVAAVDQARASALDVRFHEAICRASRHKRLLRTWLGMSSQIRLVSSHVIDTQYRDMGPIAVRHAALIAVIRAGDPEAAEHAIREHIGSVAKQVMAALTEMEPRQTVLRDGELFRAATPGRH